MPVRDTSTRMTEGSIWRKIVRFAIPVFWGNLFQQLYNVVDSLVVGNYLGSEALAAVGSSGSLIHLMVGFINGIFMGAGVVVSQFYGARDRENVRRAVHTTVGFGVLAGLALTALGVAFTPVILGWMGTPPEVMPNSVLYFRIYFSGVLAMVMYNTFSGIFQAVGDSRHPLMYLIVSSVLNVLLDLLFVGTFRMGVDGAAIATVISQAVSAILAFRRLASTDQDYRLFPRMIRVEPKMLKRILQMGLPSGVQNSIIAFANLIVQSSINAFGANAMAGCGSYSKIEGFAFLPISSFSLAMATFIGQNTGAKQFDRARRGARFGILGCMSLSMLIAGLIYLLAPTLLSAFSDDAEVVAFGTLQAHTIVPFYFLLAFTHCTSGILRGAGKAVLPMAVMIICWCAIRITYIMLATRVIPALTNTAPQIQSIFWAYPMTWLLSSILLFFAFRRYSRLHWADAPRSLAQT